MLKCPTVQTRDKLKCKKPGQSLGFKKYWSYLNENGLCFGGSGTQPLKYPNWCNLTQYTLLSSTMMLCTLIRDFKKVAAIL